MYIWSVDTVEDHLSQQQGKKLHHCIALQTYHSVDELDIIFQQQLQGRILMPWIVTKDGAAIVGQSLFKKDVESFFVIFLLL